MAKHYISIDDNGVIVGAYTDIHCEPVPGDILVSENENRSFNWDGITIDDIIYEYKYVDGVAVKRTAEELEEDTPAASENQYERRIAELEAQNEMLTECILELSEIIYS